MAKKQPLRERFQQLAGLKPLYEAEYGKYFGGRTKGGDPRRKAQDQQDLVILEVLKTLNLTMLKQ